MRKLLLSLIALTSFIGSAQAYNSIDKVRIGENKGQTRLVFEAKKGHKINTKKVFLLPNPPRLVIDLPTTKFTNGAENVNIDPKSTIKEIREGVFNRSTHRVVVDLKRGVKYKYFKLPSNKSSGERFVVDLTPTSQANYYKPTASSFNYLKESGNEVSVQATNSSKKKKFVVVIDAGHGGVDPGAVGKIGRKQVYEKTITLTIAKKLQREINKYPHMTAYLTRSSDVFVPLRTRIKRASKRDADLFISIHADAHNSSKVRGGSVYVLSETSSDKEAARLARIANRGDEVAGVILKNEARDIQSILIDLTQRESMNKSALLAQDVLGYMKDVVYVRHLKAKFAGFVVLKSADIPSILVETSYISNPQDIRILTNPKKQDQLAAAIAKGTAKYFRKNY